MLAFVTKTKNESCASYAADRLFRFKTKISQKYPSSTRSLYTLRGGVLRIAGNVVRIANKKSFALGDDTMELMNEKTIFGVMVLLQTDFLRFFASLKFKKAARRGPKL